MYFTSLYYIDIYPNIYDITVLSNLFRKVEYEMDVKIEEIVMNKVSKDANGEIKENIYSLKNFEAINHHEIFTNDFTYILELKTKEIESIRLFFPSEISPFIFSFTTIINNKINPENLYLSFLTILTSLEFCINNSFGTRYYYKYYKDAYMGIVTGPFGDLFEKKIISRYLLHASNHWKNHIFLINDTFSIQRRLVNLTKEQLDNTMRNISSYKYYLIGDSIVFVQVKHNHRENKFLKSFFQKMNLY